MKLLHTKTSLLLLALLGGFATAPWAATITYETRAIAPGAVNPNAVDPITTYKDWGWSTGGAITTNTISNFNGTTPVNKSFAHLKVEFNVGSAFATNTWGFQLAPDAGHGGILLLDGVEIDSDTSNLWWGGNWGATTELLSKSGLNLTSGAYILEAYWAEDGSSGAQGGQFTTDGTTWQALNTENLNKAAVPLPAAAWLFGSALLGVFGIGARRRVA